MTISTRRTGSGLALLAVVVGVGCADLSTEGGGPLELTITASQTTATVGTEIQFDYTAKGSFLAGVILDYGDLSPLDSIPALGAQSSSGRRPHTYTEAGEFQMTGKVEDSVQGTLTRQIQIEITPVTPAPVR